MPGAALRQANCYYLELRRRLRRPLRSSAPTTARIADGERRARRRLAHLLAADPASRWRWWSRHLVGIAIENERITVDPVLPPALDGLRVATELVGRRIELVYRVGAAGHGTRSVSVNGRPLAIDRLTNPYRIGAAAVDRREFDDACVNGVNLVEITVG